MLIWFYLIHKQYVSPTESIVKCEAKHDRKENDQMWKPAGTGAC